MSKFSLAVAVVFLAVGCASLVAFLDWAVEIAWVDLTSQLSASAARHDDELQRGQAKTELPMGQLILEGRRVQKLRLVDERGKSTQIHSPGPSETLPAGRYRVDFVELQGGYRWFGRSLADEGWIQLSPGKPYRLSLGGLLNPRVRVSRWGRFLQLDYKLLDAGGRDYTLSQPGEPPHFTVYRDHRQIGAGSFAYG